MNHPEPRRWAEYAQDRVGDPDAARLRDHLASCADCRSVLHDLEAMTATLARTPAPPMPPGVQDRLADALRAEAARRTAAEPAKAAHPPVGSTIEPDDLARRRARRGRLGRRLLAAAAVVVVAGVGGTVALDVLGGSTGDSAQGPTVAEEQADAQAGSPTAGKSDQQPRERPTETGGKNSGQADGQTDGQTDGQSSGSQQGPQAVAPRDQEEAGLIQEVYLTRTVVALRERSQCVARALSDPGWQGSSYSVELSDGGPGAVAFQPAPGAAEPGEQVVGMLISCGDHPRVLDRQPLAQ